MLAGVGFCPDIFSTDIYILIRFHDWCYRSPTEATNRAKNKNESTSTQPSSNPRRPLPTGSFIHRCQTTDTQETLMIVNLTVGPNYILVGGSSYPPAMELARVSYIIISYIDIILCCQHKNSRRCRFQHTDVEWRFDIMFMVV